MTATFQQPTRTRLSATQIWFIMIRDRPDVLLLQSRDVRRQGQRESRPSRPTRDSYGNRKRFYGSASVSGAQLIDRGEASEGGRSSRQGGRKCVYCALRSCSLPLILGFKRHTIKIILSFSGQLDWISSGSGGFECHYIGLVVVGFSSLGKLAEFSSWTVWICRFRPVWFGWCEITLTTAIWTQQEAAEHFGKGIK